MPRARRGRGEGSIYYVADRGEWVGSASLGSDPETGKRIRRTVYAQTKQEVIERLDKLRARTGGSSTATKRGIPPTLREFAEVWLESEVRLNLAATTFRSYSGILRNHVFPVLGTMRVNEIDPDDVGRCVAIVRETASASMAAKARTLLALVMGHALRREKTHRNPLTGVTVPKFEKRAMKFLTAAQIQSLFVAAEGDRFEGLVVLLATAGLRVGEARALTWADVDLSKRTIAITKTAQEAFGKITFVDPKTDAGKRVVAIGLATVQALQKRKKLAEAEKLAKPKDLVFPSTTGTAMRLSNLHRRWWQPLLEKAGLERVRIHDLRHSSASLSLLAGTDSKIVATRLGHVSPTFTQRTYQHAVAELERQDAAAIDRLVRPKPKTKRKSRS